MKKRSGLLINQTGTRLTNKIELVCNMTLDWGQKKPPCRDLVKNNPQSIREHMIKKHFIRQLTER